MKKIQIQQTGDAELVPSSDGRLSISVPIKIKQRRSHKLITLPGGEILQPNAQNTPPTPVQLALARGHCWLAQMETGEVKSLAEIARRDRVDDSYVSRMVNFTLLAPDIVSAILDNTLPAAITLFDLAVDPPLLWQDQRHRLASIQASGPVEL